VSGEETYKLKKLFAISRNVIFTGPNKNKNKKIIIKKKVSSESCPPTIGASFLAMKY